MSYGLAWSLLQGFLREWGTHTQAAVSGWKFPASYGDVMVALSYRAYLIAHSEEKERGRVSVPLPWPSPSEAAASVQVTDEEMDAALARLEQVSAIRD